MTVCAGKSCGPDGCGGVCGLCANGGTCQADGQCVGGTDPPSPGSDAGTEVPGQNAGGPPVVPGDACPEGYVLKYGQCVWDANGSSATGQTVGGSSGGGCAYHQPTSATPFVLLMTFFFALVWAGRRRFQRDPSSS